MYNRPAKRMPGSMSGGAQSSRIVRLILFVLLVLLVGSWLLPKCQPLTRLHDVFVGDPEVYLGRGIKLLHVAQEQEPPDQASLDAEAKVLADLSHALKLQPNNSDKAWIYPPNPER